MSAEGRRQGGRERGRDRPGSRGDTGFQPCHLKIWLVVGGCSNIWLFVQHDMAGCWFGFKNTAACEWVWKNRAWCEKWSWVRLALQNFG